MKRKLLPVLLILLIPIFNNCEKDSDNSSSFIVNDYDGNNYKTVQIGDQIWMAENLKATHYSDGTVIQLVEDGTSWYYLGYTDKAMCYYNNSIANKSTYGGLYTWAAAMKGAPSSTSNPSGVQGVCPDGWHLPSDDEWKELEIYLGMSQTDANRADYRGSPVGSKLAGDSTLWNKDVLRDDSNFGTSEFWGLPSGRRSSVGMFTYLGESTTFWSATEYDSSRVWYRHLAFNYSDVLRYWNVYKNEGRSIRCIKD